MPNPTSLANGDPGTVSATAASQAITLASEHAWDVVHTGYTAAGAANDAPVWLGVGQSSVVAGAAQNVVLLPPGQTFTFPKGTRQLAYLSGGSGEPILTLISSREGFK